MCVKDAVITSNDGNIAKGMVLQQPDWKVLGKSSVFVKQLVEEGIHKADFITNSASKKCR